MSTPRLRRLRSEQADLRELTRTSSLVRVAERGDPPTQYVVTLSCLGLALVGGALVPVGHHEFALTLGDDFPTLPPTIVWRTPVFHPNIKPPDVCTGDIWYPALSLAELCESLCEMVQYKSFNVYDPLDTDAATWLRAHLDSDRPEIPVDPRPVRDLDFPIEARKRPAAG